MLAPDSQNPKYKVRVVKKILVGYPTNIKSVLIDFYIYNIKIN
jgi:hypothetical protein